MATVSIKRLPKFDVNTNSFTRKTFAKSSTGDTIEIDETILTPTLLSEINNSLKFKQFQCFNGKVNFNIGEKYVSDSLNFYLNGSNVTLDIELKGEDFFNISEEASYVLSDNDIAFATYVVSLV